MTKSRDAGARRYVRREFVGAVEAETGCRAARGFPRCAVANAVAHASERAARALTAGAPRHPRGPAAHPSAHAQRRGEAITSVSLSVERKYARRAPRTVLLLLRRRLCRCGREVGGGGCHGSHGAAGVAPVQPGSWGGWQEAVQRERRLGARRAAGVRSGQLGCAAAVHGARSHGARSRRARGWNAQLIFIEQSSIPIGGGDRRSTLRRRPSSRRR